MKAKELALGGVLAAAAVGLMLLGGLFPLAVYAAPMLASMPLVLLLRRLPRGVCVGWYAAVSLLSLILCADKETALVFAFLGWYPIAREPLQGLPRLPRIALKLLIFNAAVAALYALLILVLRLDELVAEAKELSFAMGALLLSLGNAGFLLFDRLLAVQTSYIESRAGKRK